MSLVRVGMGEMTMSLNYCTLFLKVHDFKLSKRWSSICSSFKAFKRTLHAV